MQSSAVHFTQAPSAIIEPGCVIGERVYVGPYSHVLKGCGIGADTILGQNVMVGPEVQIGAFCKIEDNVCVYQGVYLEEYVICGDSVVFTNVFNPRAEIERKNEFRATHVEPHVRIGSNATIVCGVRLGTRSVIAPGAVVTKNVRAHAIVEGNPARHVGWVSHSGARLTPDLTCPQEGQRYYVTPENELRLCDTAST